MESLLSLIMINAFNTLSINNSFIFAYIDPGTGSIILQAILGALVGAAVAAKLFWHRILKFFGIRKTTSADTKGIQENK